MYTVTVLQGFQTPRLRDNCDRAFGFNIEEYYWHWMQKHRPSLNIDFAYLPIFWWNNSAVGYLAHGAQGFRAVREIEEFVSTLGNRWCYTVSRGADGIYEKLTDRIVIFSAGGKGDFPTPHLCEINPMTTDPIMRSRDLLASFVGNIECGGPETPPPKGRSSWDVDGAGATLRRLMRDVFDGEPDCLIKQQQMASWNAQGVSRHEEFCEVAERSWFGLAPRGYGKTSYRLYEMLHLGTIPVYVYDEPWLPYLDRLDWREFAVLCHVSELPTLPQRLRDIPDERRLKMISRGQELVPDYFTPDATCRQIAYYASLL